MFRHLLPLSLLSFPSPANCWGTSVPADAARAAARLGSARPRWWHGDGSPCLGAARASAGFNNGNWLVRVEGLFWGGLEAIFPA